MHFLSRLILEHKAVSLWNPRAAVSVMVEGETLTIYGSPGAVEPGQQFVPLPSWYVVVGPGGRKIRPSKGCEFGVSADTFDPAHVLVEVPTL